MVVPLINIVVVELFLDVFLKAFQLRRSVFRFWSLKCINVFRIKYCTISIVIRGDVKQSTGSDSHVGNQAWIGAAHI